jgi:hypothetical protein
MISKNVKQWIFFILAVVVVGLAVVRFQHRSRGWEAEPAELGDPLLPGFQPGIITGVDILGSETQVELRKVEEDKWVVESKYGYPAKFPALGSLVSTIEKQKVKRVLEESKAILDRLELTNPPTLDDGLVIRFLEADGAVYRTVVLGKMHWLDEAEKDNPRAWPQGRYVYVPELGRVALIKEPFKFVRTDPADWLEQRFFEISRVDSVEYVDEAGKTQWRMFRENESDPMRLEKPPEEGEVDQDALHRVSGAFSWIEFADIANPEASDEETGLGASRTVRVADLAGNEAVFEFGRAREDGLVYVRIRVTPVQIADVEEKDVEYQEKIEKLAGRVNGWTYLLRTSQFSEVLVNKSAFLVAEE